MHAQVGRIECACSPCPLPFHKIEIEPPVVPSKKTIDMTSCGRILLPFVATCFGSSRSKIEKTALPYQLTQLDPVTRHIPIHLLFFLNTA